MEFVEVAVCGLKRRFPVVSMGPKLRIVSVTLLGDVELVNAAAEQLVEKIRGLKPEVLVGPETKVVPLLHKMSEIMGLPRYVVCRKGIQAYMIDPLVVRPASFRNNRVKEMAIDGRDAQYIKSKKVVIVDDVVFTGSSLKMVRDLLNRAESDYLGTVAVFKQGDKFDGEYMYLTALPNVINV